MKFASLNSNGVYLVYFSDTLDQESENGVHEGVQGNGN